MRRVPLLMLLASLGVVGISCKKTKTATTPPASFTPRPLNIPKDFKSGSALVAIRVTNSSSTATSTHRSLSNIFNRRVETSQLIMRGGLKTDNKGKPILPGLGKSQASAGEEEHADMLGGTSLE